MRFLSNNKSTRSLRRAFLQSLASLSRLLTRPRRLYCRSIWFWSLTSFFHIASRGSQFARMKPSMFSWNITIDRLSKVSVSSRFALYNGQKNVAISIFFYIKKISSSLTDESCREQFAADTHQNSFYIELSYIILSRRGKRISALATNPLCHVRSQALRRHPCSASYIYQNTEYGLCP